MFKLRHPKALIKGFILRIVVEGRDKLGQISYCKSIIQIIKVQFANSKEKYTNTIHNEKVHPHEKAKKYVALYEIKKC